jgi:hypothetical protein
MNEINELLSSWKADGFINPEALKSAHDAIMLLVAKVEALEELLEKDKVQ